MVEGLLTRAELLEERERDREREEEKKDKLDTSLRLN